jgi:hypothetical protein
VANPTYPAAPAQPPRPTTVTISTYLLWLTAAMSLISAALSVSMVGRMADALGDLFEGTAGEGSEGFIVGASVFVGVLSLLFAAGLAILGIFNNRGRNGARITTWVLGGISLCCTGFGLAGTAMSSSMNLDSSSTGGTVPSNTEVQNAINGALPSWYEPLSTVLTVISLLAILGAVILLALPASNAFFRKVQPAWDPNQQFPYPGGQPGYPQSGYPQSPYPGQPYQPGQPGQPSPGQQPYQPGQPPYQPEQPPPAPPSAPPASGPTPPTDPWGRPAEGDKRPPSDPTS